MRITLRLVPALVAWALLSAPGDAAALRLEDFFKGDLTGTGEVDNYRDGTQRAFTATIHGSWQGPHGTVVEDLTYRDGETRHIVWTFDRTAEGRFTGHRDDLVNEADVFQDGDSVRMRYSARTRVPSGKIWTLTFDDRFTEAAPNVVTLSGDVSYLFIGVGVTRMRIVKTGR